jgi:hypothetical protein
MTQPPDDPVRLQILDVAAQPPELPFEADCTTGTIEAVAKQWVRGWEAVRLSRLEPAIRNTLGCGRPESGFALLINNPNKLMFYAKWAD